MKIKSVAPPKDADERYQFFKDDNGQMWKAAVDTKVARPAMLAQADVEAAPAELALTVTVSPVDDNGKALRNEDDKPIIVDTLTHTFTGFEMTEADFDPVNRISQIIAERIELGTAQLSGHKKLADFVDNWNKTTKLNLDIDTETLPQPIIAESRIAKPSEQPGVPDNGNQ